MALNTALSLTRRPQLFTNTEEIPDHSFDMEHAMDKSESVLILYRAISQLSKVEKAIILLWLEDKPYEEIADNLGLSVKNTSVRLVRIKGKLKNLIKKYE